jgi:hypothetical protein
MVAFIETFVDDPFIISNDHIRHDYPPFLDVLRSICLVEVFDF